MARFPGSPHQVTGKHWQIGHEARHRRPERREGVGRRNEGDREVESRLRESRRLGELASNKAPKGVPSLPRRTQRVGFERGAQPRREFFKANREGKGASKSKRSESGPLDTSTATRRCWPFVRLSRAVTKRGRLGGGQAEE